MSDDKSRIHIDPRERTTPDVDVCPDHPDVEPEVGFGLAGGGYGSYTYCPVCYRVLTKTMEHDGKAPPTPETEGR